MIMNNSVLLYYDKDLFLYPLSPVNSKEYPTIVHPSKVIHAAVKPDRSTIIPNKLDPVANPTANAKLIIPSLTLASFLPKTSLAINAGADMYE